MNRGVKGVIQNITSSRSCSTAKTCGIDEYLAKHRQGLIDRGLADLPFHAGPILNGHDDYESMDFKTRKSYFNLFSSTCSIFPLHIRHLFISAVNWEGKKRLSLVLRRDITNLLFDNLSYFQSFDRVKIYYDDGQEIVAKALHAAVEYVLSKQGVLYRTVKASEYMLAQAADMLCALELTAHKFQNKEATRTDEKMFGSASSFKNNYLKAIKRKRLAH